MINRFFSSGRATLAAALILTLNLIATRTIASPFQVGDILYTDSFGAVFGLHPATRTGMVMRIIHSGLRHALAAPLPHVIVPPMSAMPIELVASA